MTCGKMASKNSKEQSLRKQKTKESMNDYMIRNLNNLRRKNNKKQSIRLPNAHLVDKILSAMNINY